ncbi:hypothetical protein [Streptosporangium sp. NPDC087985]|uniref:hypothetical protein n=1 Tax=Streptosporangium sp. NPDC087985 TaxID=3366196 RepID=UPI0037FD1CAA
MFERVRYEAVLATVPARALRSSVKPRLSRCLDLLNADSGFRCSARTGMVAVGRDSAVPGDEPPEAPTAMSPRHPARRARTAISATARPENSRW